MNETERVQKQTREEWLNDYFKPEQRETEMKIDQMRESKYLKKEDVGTGKLVTISRIEHENVAMENDPPELKYTMYFKETEKGIVLNWTNIQLCAKATGSDETEDWPGKKIVLYEDPNVSFGGKLVGGIRIRAAKIQPAKTSEEFNPAKTAEELDYDIPF